ncbi:MAG: anthranilate synthase component II [Mariniblastus sp.]
MILVIDNYDSFVHNLARHFHQLNCDTEVIRNDKITTRDIEQMSPDAIVLSPGPCTPDEAGCSLEIVRHFQHRIPMLGICLGHQTIVKALGGHVVMANEPVHGRQSRVIHTSSPMFHGITTEFNAGRYHSLVAQISKLPEDLRVTARSDDGTIMAVEHQSHPVVGLQFHPESILTDCGYRLLYNFLTLANLLSKETSKSFSRLCQFNELEDLSPPTAIRSHRLSTAIADNPNPGGISE